MENNVVFNLSYGLYILSAKDGEKDNGCVVNTVMQISDNPLVGIVSVNKGNYTHDMIVKTKELNVSILSEKAEMDIFKRFGFQSGKDTDKFQGLTGVARSENGINYLTENANGYISCKVLDIMDFTSHSVFKIEMVDGKVLSKDPSVTYAYYHKNIKPQPESTKAKGWVCNICGYVYEDDNLPADFICPLCKHGASDFKKL